MNSLKYIKGELNWLKKGGNRQLDQDEEIRNLENVKKDLEILYIFRKHLAFYSSDNPTSEWCDLIGLGNVPTGELDKITPMEYKKVKKWRENYKEEI